MMKTYWIALALTMALTTGGVAAYAATTTNYPDVNNNWAQSDINTMLNQNVMTGFNDGMFHPDAWVTRSEFTAMTAKTLSLPQQQADTVPSLKNVSQNTAGFQSVDNQAWISSYPNGVFRPANPVRRVEVLSGLAGSLNKPLVSDDEANQILGKYSDAADVPVNSRREVATAIKYNLFEIDPKSGQDVIEPLRPATRAETAAMLSDLYDQRDIAIVQNGQLVSSADNTTGSPACPTGTTTGTSMVKEEPATTTSGQASNIDFMQGKGTPYRSSADNISAFRSVNTSPAPSGVAASEPMTLAPNTTFTGTVAKALYSSYNKPGDPVMLIVDHPIYDSNGRIIAPAGSKVLGILTDVVSRNESGQDVAELGMNFNALITPAGQQIPISAKVNNTDGILKAGDLQGVVFHPNRSTAALKREINASTGSLYGLKQGKAEVLQQPLVEEVSDRPLDPMDLRTADIVIGVGDRLQLRLDELGPNALTTSNSNSSYTNSSNTNPSNSNTNSNEDDNSQ